MKKRLLTLCVLLLSGTLFTACNDTKNTGGGTGDGKDPVAGTSATCGNRQKDNGEKCDKNAEGDDACPADQSACNKLMESKPNSCIKGYTFKGNVDDCTAECVPEWFDDCNRTTGDSCGKKGAQPNATLGQKCNSALQGFAAGHCPTANECANDQIDACQTHKLKGKALDCTAECVPDERITQPIHGDGCCPDPTLSESQDNDCVPPVNMGEACTKDSECQAGNGGNDAYCLFYEGNSAANGKTGVCTTTCDAASPSSCGFATTGLICMPFQGRNGVCTKFCGGGLADPDSVCKGDDMHCYFGLACYPLKATQAQNIGSACTANTQCGEPDGRCFQENFGGEGTFKDGVCTADCKILGPGTVSCPENSQCAGEQCVQKCKGDGDCRDGYTCTQAGLCDTLGKKCMDSSECTSTASVKPTCNDYGGALGKRCGWVGTGSKAPGKECDNVSECSGGISAVCLQYDPDNGMCAKKCATNGDCGADEKCVPTVNSRGVKNNICTKTCADDNACSTDSSGLPSGFTCYSMEDVDGAISKVCGEGLAQGNMGAICDDNSTCTGPGAFCYKEAATNAKGVCARSCTTPTQCTIDNALCAGPPDSVNHCFASCKTDATVCDSYPGTICKNLNPQISLCVAKQP